MKIEIDTTSLSPLDLRILAVLAEAEFPAAEVKTPPQQPKKAAPKKAVVEEAPAPEPVAEDTPEPDVAGPTMADAVAAATQLVSSGEAAKVKAALAAVGAKRVSEVAPENIAAFIAALA